MRNRIVLSLCLGLALCLAAARPAAAQDLGLGLSILGDEGGTGFIIDYAKPFREQSNGNMISWVGDFSWHRNSFDNFFSDYSISSLLAQAGVRLSGPLGESLTWHGQGLVGIRRTAFGGDDFESVCDFFGESCSDTGGVLTIGGAVQYQLGESGAVRGQLDFPIGIGGGGGSTTRFSLMYVLRMGGN